MKYIRPISIAALSLALSGCYEPKVTTPQLCERHPDLHCETLNISDGHCQAQRNTLIQQRLAVLQSPSDHNKINEYYALGEYQSCLALVSQIEFKHPNELHRTRVEALMQTGADKAHLAQELQDSKEPETLYFLWSELGNTSARRALLDLEGTEALETTHLQYALATIYANIDNPRTLALLNHALELVQQGEPVEPQILNSLANTYYQQGDKKRAYLWTRIAQKSGSNVVSESDLKRLYEFDDDTYQQLGALSSQIITALQQGEYQTRLVEDALPNKQSEANTIR